MQFVKVHTQKSEERLTVPATLLRRIGARPGKKVFLCKHKDSITVTTKKTGNVYRAYKLSKNGNIRLRKSLLETWISNGATGFVVYPKGVYRTSNSISLQGLLPQITIEPIKIETI